MAKFVSLYTFLSPNSYTCQCPMLALQIRSRMKEQWSLAPGVMLSAKARFTFSCRFNQYPTVISSPITILTFPVSKYVYLLKSKQRVSSHCRFYHISSNLARKKIQDPRRNVQYPFVPGDPLQTVQMISKRKTEGIKALNQEKGTRDRQRQSQSQKSNANTFKEQQVASRKVLGKDYNVKKQIELQLESLNEKEIQKIKLGKLILGERHLRFRRKSETIILEGSRLVKDALLAGAEAWCLCFCRQETLEQLGEAQGFLDTVKLYRISPDTMKIFSDTVTPGGILGVFKKPNQGEALCPPHVQLPISLVCDSLKDPGNAGTLIRTAAAIGCKRIFATQGCVNLWERKVLRSAMGAHFNIPIYSRVSWEDISSYLGPQVQVLLANNYTTNTLEHAFDSHLNTGLEKNDLDFEHVSSESNDAVQTDNDLSESEGYKFHNAPLPVFEYSDVQLNVDMQYESIDMDKMVTDIPGEIALVVGSEAAGLSALAKKFAYHHHGAYVTIPMNETTNSLNSGIAGSVILYELRKKLMKFV